MLTSSRFRAGAYLRRRDLQYDEDSFFLGSDLSQELNHTSSSEGIQVKYDATPYTTFAVAAERVRDRFRAGSTRDSDGYVVAASGKDSDMHRLDDRYPALQLALRRKSGSLIRRKISAANSSARLAP